jgi:hypothetical protein
MLLLHSNGLASLASRRSCCGDSCVLVLVTLLAARLMLCVAVAALCALQLASDPLDASCCVALRQRLLRHNRLGGVLQEEVAFGEGHGCCSSAACVMWLAVLLAVWVQG